MSLVDEIMATFKGVSLVQIAVVVLLLAFGIFARNVVSRMVVTGITKKIRAKSDPLIQPEHLAELVRPLSLIFVVSSIWVAKLLVSFPHKMTLVLDRLVQSFLAVAVFWAVHAIVGPLLNHHYRKKTLKLNAEVKDFLIRFFHVIIVIVMVLTVFQVWGRDVTTFLAGLGIFGMAIGFAAQDSIKNIFGCIAILTDKSFHKGDWIKTNDVEGTVESIGFRTTSVRRFDKALVHIPNSKLADTAVVNFAKMTVRRVRWEVGLVYGTPSHVLEAIVKRIREYIYAHPGIEKDHKKAFTLVNLDCFADSSINIFIYFYTKTIHWGEYMQIKEEVLLAVKKIVEEEGSDFAFPSRSIYLEKMPETAQPTRLKETLVNKNRTAVR